MNRNIATVTLNPAVDQTVSIPDFTAGEVNRVEWEQSDPGGKGVNVASFLADFGYRRAVTGFLGNENAPLLEKLFTDKRIEDRFVRIAGKTRINIKIVDERQSRITEINLPGPSPGAGDVATLKAHVESLATQYDWFVLSGSIPAGLSPSIYRELVARLKDRGRRVVVDTSGAPLSQALSAGPYAIKPNIEELRELVGKPLESETAILEAARGLVGQGIQCVVVSMGSRGALFLEGENHVHARAETEEIRSTVGAGDAMVAGLVTAKTRGLSLPEFARLATAFSIGALSRLGPRLPEPRNVESLTDRVVTRTLD